MLIVSSPAFCFVLGHLSKFFFLLIPPWIPAGWGLCHTRCLLPLHWKFVLFSPHFSKGHPFVIVPANPPQISLSLSSHLSLGLTLLHLSSSFSCHVLFGIVSSPILRIWLAHIILFLTIVLLSGLFSFQYPISIRLSSCYLLDLLFALF